VTGVGGSFSGAAFSLIGSSQIERFRINLPAAKFKRNAFENNPNCAAGILRHNRFVAWSSRLLRWPGEIGTISVFLSSQILVIETKRDVTQRNYRACAPLKMTIRLSLPGYFSRFLPNTCSAVLPLFPRILRANCVKLRRRYCSRAASEN
jgi:hypothetical protein